MKRTLFYKRNGIIPILLISAAINGQVDQNISNIERSHRVVLTSLDSASLRDVRYKVQQLNKEKDALYNHLVDSITSGQLPVELGIAYAEMIAPNSPTTIDLLAPNLTYYRPNIAHDPMSLKAFPFLYSCVLHEESYLLFISYLLESNSFKSCEFFDPHPKSTSKIETNEGVVILDLGVEDRVAETLKSIVKQTGRMDWVKRLHDEAEDSCYRENLGRLIDGP